MRACLYRCTVFDFNPVVQYALKDKKIETVSPDGTFCDTVQVASGADDMELI